VLFRSRRAFLNKGKIMTDEELEDFIYIKMYGSPRVKNLYGSLEALKKSGRRGKRQRS